MVEFRRCTLLPLDNVLGCLLRHGISRLPPRPEQTSKRGASPMRGVIAAFPYALHTVLTATNVVKRRTTWLHRGGQPLHPI